MDEKLDKLADAVDRMTNHMQGSDTTVQALDRMTAGQERMISGQERLVDFLEAQEHGEGMDAESRMRLRSIDVQMLRILEEISAGRQETMAELRRDISLLAKAVSGGRQTPDQSRRPAHGTGSGDS